MNAVLIIALVYALTGILTATWFVRRDVVFSRDYLTVCILGAFLGVPLLVLSVLLLLLDLPEVAP